MVEQAKNSINNLYHFMHVLSVLSTQQSIVTKDAFNKIGSKHTSLNALVKIQRLEIRFYCQMCKE
jgi:hypothetical protein